MKIALMSGAYVNAGDFLIEHRCKLLLENILHAQVDILQRNISYDDKIKELNQYDAIVFGGGPGFQRDLYPNKIPFVKDLTSIKVPVRILGWGWKGKNDEYRNFRDYQLNREMLSYVKFVEKQYPLMCRDWQTIRMLKQNGISKHVMTGCPAWYDLSMINQLQLDKKYMTNSIDSNIKIGISDSAYSYNKRYFQQLIVAMRTRFPMSEIVVFFHRGLNNDDLCYMNKVCSRDEKIKYVDMAGSDEKFSLYNECYFHIGFRVHAHIYNLSQGKVSVLINEDARGIGVNHALGIENINCCLIKGKFNTNRISLKDFSNVLNDYLDYVINSHYIQYSRATFSISETYNVMYKYIKDML